MDRKTIFTSTKIVLLLVFNLLVISESQKNDRTGKDFHNYLLPEEEKRPDYQVFPYPPNFQYKDDYAECARNPMLPVLGKALNLILLKLGAFGIIKALIALIFAGFLVKIPLLLLKVAFFKSFFLPFLAAPLLMQLFTNQMTQPSETESDSKPSETQTETPGLMGINEMAMEMGRQINDNLTFVALDSMKMFIESDQCVERISCMIGASTKGSSFGNIFGRVLKYLHYSSPPSLQKKITQIKEAFNKGGRSSTCLEEDYECRSPELLLQYGVKKVKIL